MADGDPLPTRYRVERRAGDGDWEFLTYYDYEYDAVGQNHGYDYNDDDVTPDVTYVYRVRTENSEGCSPWLVSGEKTAVWKAPNNFKSNPVTVEQVGGNLSVSWSAPDGAETFTLLRAESATALSGSFWPSDTQFSSWPTSSPTPPTPTRGRGRPAGPTPIRSLRRTRGQKESPSMAWRKLKITVTMPDGPEDLRGYVEDGIVYLSWTEMPRAHHYWIERALGSDMTTGFTTMSDYNTGTRYWDVFARKGTTYTYRVSANCGSYYSAASYITMRVPNRPGAFWGPIAQNTEEATPGTSLHGIVVSWGEPAGEDPADGFILWRSEDDDDFIEDDTFVELVYLPNDGDLFYVDTAVRPGLFYAYGITPVNAAGWGTIQYSEPVAPRGYRAAR